MKKTKANERHWIMENVKLKKPIYFKDVLTSKWRSENNMLEERLYFVSTEGGRYWISSKYIKIRFDWWRLPENLDYRHEEKSRNRTGQVMPMLIPQHGSSSETV